MYWALIVLHVLVSSFLVLVVLLQAGKGGGMGIAFGGGGSQTVFGSSGAGNFLTKLTAICATIFFLNSLGLAYISSKSDSSRLKTLGEQKAAQKSQEEAAKKKVLDDVAKERAAQQKTAPTSATPGTTGTSATPSSAPITIPVTPTDKAPAAPAPATAPTPAPSAPAPKPPSTP